MRNAGEIAFAPTTIRIAPPGTGHDEPPVLDMDPLRLLSRRTRRSKKTAPVVVEEPHDPHEHETHVEICAENDQEPDKEEEEDEAPPPPEPEFVEVFRAPTPAALVTFGYDSPANEVASVRFDLDLRTGAGLIDAGHAAGAGAATGRRRFGSVHAARELGRGVGVAARRRRVGGCGGQGAPRAAGPRRAAAACCLYSGVGAAVVLSTYLVKLNTMVVSSPAPPRPGSVAAVGTREDPRIRHGVTVRAGTRDSVSPRAPRAVPDEQVDAAHEVTEQRLERFSIEFRDKIRIVRVVLDDQPQRLREPFQHQPQSFA